MEDAVIDSCNDLLKLRLVGLWGVALGNRLSVMQVKYVWVAE